MTARPVHRRVLRDLLCLVFMWMIVLPQMAEAHRPDESYLYLIVDEVPLSGQFHIRFSDMAKAVPLDTDGDGVILDDEVLQNYDAIAEHLSGRVRFFDDAGSHVPVLGDVRFFGENERRQMLLEFQVPSINPPPEMLEVEFRFLYDSVDPDHTPMLLVKSNTRTRLRYNESHVSLEFATGADRQSISLVPPPYSELVLTTLQKGFLLVLNNPNNLLIALAALLGSLRWYALHQPDRASTGALAGNIVLVSGLLGLGFATGLLFREYFPFRLSSHDTKNVLAAALGMAAVANLLVRRQTFRAIALLAAGGLCGIAFKGFGAVVGLNKGYIETVYPGLAIGVFAACCVLAVVVLPLGVVFTRDGRLTEKILRIGSIAIASVACLFLFQRLVLL